MVLRYKQQLGLAIRARRIELGLTHKQLIERLSIEETQTVSRWERGLTMPADLEAVAEALETTISALMAGIQPPAQVARKFDMVPDIEPPAESQLDRIEGKLDDLIAALLSDAGSDDQPGSVVAGVVARLRDAAASPPPEAPAAPKSPQAARPRKRA